MMIDTELILSELRLRIPGTILTCDVGACRRCQGTTSSGMKKLCDKCLKNVLYEDGPTFDADGSPTDATLEKIKMWPVGDYNNLMGYVEEIFRGYGRFERHGTKYILATGGWSACEAAIGAMEANFAFWITCWECSKRGGYYEFEMGKACGNGKTE